jgi:hypothetical protein
MRILSLPHTFVFIKQILIPKMMKTQRIVTLSMLLALFVGLGQVRAQGFKDRMKGKLKKDNSAIYECGYVYQPGLKDKLNPMKGLQKALGGAVTEGGESELGNIAISVFYQAHQHPQEIMRYPTATPGWETCGDAVFLGMTNRSGAGLSQTDGKVMMDGQEIAKAGMGTYYQGFKPELRGEKPVQISSSNGDKIDLAVKPGAPLEILSIDGKAKGEEILIDGTKDIVIELENGDADPQSMLHVQMVCKLVGTPIMYDVIVTRPKNTITIPKEAFKNFEGSPSPYMKDNTLIVNRVTETIIEGTDAGAIRTLSNYMDWWPVSIGGDLSKGSALTMGFDSTKNTQIKVDMQTHGDYSFVIRKEGPYTAPPVKLIRKVAVASFVVRGNLKQEITTTSSSGNVVWTNKITKWFPDLEKGDWQGLADRLYQTFETQLKTEMGWEVMPLSQVTAAEAYKHTKTITDHVTQNYVEVGAGGTKRILTTGTTDIFKDLSITFPGDFVSERLIQELYVDAVIAITFDLNFNFESEGLDPQVVIECFAPNVSYKTAAKYFSGRASTQALSLSEANKYQGGATNCLYQMIKGDTFIKEFQQAMEQLSAKEDHYPVYEKLWQAKK